MCRCFLPCMGPIQFSLSESDCRQDSSYTPRYLLRTQPYLIYCGIYQFLLACQINQDYRPKFNLGTQNGLYLWEG